MLANRCGRRGRRRRRRRGAYDRSMSAALYSSDKLSSLHDSRHLRTGQRASRAVWIGRQRRARRGNASVTAAAAAVLRPV